MIKKLIGALAASTLLVAMAATPAQAALTYFYAGAQQTITDAGAYANMTIATPTITTGDFHSLAEITVKDSTGNQAVEFGWTVDPTLNGDSNPHLFVYWWKNGVGQCYNTGCTGYTAYASATIAVGATLSNGAMRFGIQHSSGAWWVWYGTTGGVGNWVGFISDTNWTTAWTSFGKAQFFGEVAVNVASPTTLMGNGACSGGTTPASFGSVQYVTNPVANVNLTTTGMVTDSTKYDSTLASARTFKYGGDGSCP